MAVNVRNGLKRAIQLACFIAKLANKYGSKAEAAAAGVTTVASASGGLSACLGQLFAAAACVCQYRETPEA